MKCALCRKDAILELSHIIPKFVYRSMKKNSPTGNMRLMSEPNRKIQDGDKQNMLCGECEDFFNHCDIIGYVSDQNIDPFRLDVLIQAEKVMRAFLLGERQDLGEIENHVFFFNPIETASDEMADLNLHTIFGSSIFGYTFISYDYDSYYVFLNLQGLVLVTIIKAAEQESWKNTLVHNEGSFDPNKPQYITTPLFSEIEYLAQERKQSMEQMSDKQREKILEAIKRDPEKFKNSKAFQRMLNDQLLRNQ
ncbi:hypothetical protein JGK52_17595 [Cytobacillus oceanisediminis]|uniref:hypothetical protein n=1 Tax=Cytobacillus oceanisediminis TaxID=665099 RepID=UPI001D13D269|nr:hypothetical protein [Cytobacillus oceanisediminis]MCC3648478.1 hypothetical protein [Cytobacillus oceanisediminis]